MLVKSGRDGHLKERKVKRLVRGGEVGPINVWCVEVSRDEDVGRVMGS